MPIITLLTDFGLSDTFIGVMKGVIWTIAPGTQIVDLTHGIPPQSVMDGSFAIAEAAPFFPAGTIHVCVVDPGVGTARRAMLAVIDGDYFIGPDNGLFTLLIENAKAASFITLNNPRYWLPQVSNSFHGRDIFAPVAAHLANGVAPVELGDAYADPVFLNIPVPTTNTNGWQGQVMRVDHFGNLITNFTSQHLSSGMGVNLCVKKTTIRGLSETFGDQPSGELIAMLDSSGHLAISVVNGSAAKQLGVSAGEPVTLTFQPGKPV